MKSSRFPFYLQIIIVAAGLFWLFSYIGHRPSSQFTFLLVLISVGFLKLITYGWRRLKRLLRRWQTRFPPN